MKTSNLERAANYVILIAFALFALGPMFTIVKTALGPENADAAQDGTSLHWGNFSAAWEQGELGKHLTTSVSVSVIVVVVAVFFSIMSGYAFGTMRFKGEQVLFYLFLLGIMVPTEAIIVPLFFDLRSMRPDEHDLGCGAAADRPVGRVRHLLDADLLPQHQRRHHRGSQDRRRRKPSHPVVGAGADSPAA